MAIQPHKSRDALYVQLAELVEQRKGISPKLALHAELGRQIDEVRKELGGNGMAHGEIRLPNAVSAGGTQIPYRKLKKR